MSNQLSKVVTEAPATIIVTEAPVTKVVTEAPATKVVTEAPVTKILSESVVIKKADPLVQEEKPAFNVNSLIMAVQQPKPELILPPVTQPAVTQAQQGQVPVRDIQQVVEVAKVETTAKEVTEKSTSEVKVETPSKKAVEKTTKVEKPTKVEVKNSLPKTSAVSNETNSALPTGLASLLLAAGLMVAKRKEK